MSQRLSTVFLKMKVSFCRLTLELQRETNETLICCTIAEILVDLEVTLLWIHPIHKNLCRTQWPRVDNNIDYRDNRFVYGYVRKPIRATATFRAYHACNISKNNCCIQNKPAAFKTGLLHLKQACCIEEKPAALKKSLLH